MITLVWRTDAHLSDRSPGSRLDNWTETVLGKLAQVGEIAAGVNAHAVIDGGDFFNVKSPARNTHRLIREVADLHKSYPCPVFANVGNHDCVYGDISFLGQQPLGVLFSTGVFGRLFDHHEVYFGPAYWDGSGSGVFPYDRSTGTWAVADPFKYQTERKNQEPIVRVVGVPYHGTAYDLDRLNIQKGDEDYLVVVAHMLASPKGGAMFEGEDIVKYDSLEGFDPDVFLFGHWHKNQGIEHDHKWIVNIGSLTRGSLAQDDVRREPSIAVLRFSQEGVSIERIVLDHKPPEEVFDLETRARVEERASQMAGFVESLHESLAGGSGTPLRDEILQFPVDPRVREKAILYLERHESR